MALHTKNSHSLWSGQVKSRNGQDRLDSHLVMVEDFLGEAVVQFPQGYNISENEEGEKAEEEVVCMARQ